MKKLFLLSIIAICLISCAKDGKDGINGEAGKDGINGNANVINTQNYTVTSTQWTAFGTGWSADINVPEITSQIAASGAVFVYGQVGSEWISLPYTIGTESWAVSFGTSTVGLLVSKTDASQAANPGTVVFRVVIIPSNKIVEDINYNNYNEVKGFYNL